MPPSHLEFQAVAVGCGRFPAGIMASADGRGTYACTDISGAYRWVSKNGGSVKAARGGSEFWGRCWNFPRRPGNMASD
jgi:hypothetical protein